jgi:phosphoribosylformimino-5-aminoimidazole carboxamide ribotide isomerase
MQIIPAIDVLDGQVVRLLKGDYDEVTAYSDSPVEALGSWGKAGATLVHVVDLEGARTGTPSPGLVESMARAAVSFQLGGGIRTEAAAVRVLEAGAARVVLGSAAVWEPELLTMLVARFGADRIVAAIDVKAGLATGAGWLDEGRPFGDVIAPVVSSGVGWILTTGISRDGTMTGPDLALTREAVEQAPNCRVIGSGGVGSLADLVALQNVGAHAVVVGKALYEGVFSYEQAVSAVGKPLEGEANVGGADR